MKGIYPKPVMTSNHESTSKITEIKGNCSSENFLPIASCVVTIATNHHTERTLLPGTCALAGWSNQPGTQYSGVHPTASSAVSPARTLLFGLRWDDLHM